jgi:hypothetical protein
MIMLVLLLSTENPLGLFTATRLSWLNGSDVRYYSCMGLSDFFGGN